MWTTAFHDMRGARLTINAPQFMWGVDRKGGDLMVGGGTEDLIFFENECSTQGREAQHDPMIMRWCYRAHPQTQSVQWKPTSDAGSQEPPRELTSPWDILEPMPTTPLDWETGARNEEDAVDADKLAKDTESDVEDTGGAAEHDTTGGATEHIWCGTKQYSAPRLLRRGCPSPVL